MVIEVPSVEAAVAATAEHPEVRKPSLRERRERAGISLAKAAVLSDVSEPTARVFEIDPFAVKDERKRAALLRVYDSFEERRR